MFSKSRSQITSPWLLTVIANGLRAQNIKDTLTGMKPVKAVPIKFFEMDRIYGVGAFESAGILKIQELLEELENITPRTKGYIFRDRNYIRRPDGLLVKHRETGDESFYSHETLNNQACAVFLRLDYEGDSDRENVCNQSAEQSLIDTQNPPDLNLEVSN